MGRLLAANLRVQARNLHLTEAEMPARLGS
jgi:hypothetical protein